MKCNKCERHISEGLVFKRVNPKGEIGIWECDPVCGVPFINQESALVYALNKNEEKNDVN